MEDAIVAIVENQPECKPVISIQTLRKILHTKLITLKQLNQLHKNATSLMSGSRDKSSLSGLFTSTRSLCILMRRDFTISRGRAARGEWAVRVMGGQHSQHFSMIFTVSNRRGLLHHSFHAGGTTRAVFNTFRAGICASWWGCPSCSHHRQRFLLWNAKRGNGAKYEPNKIFNSFQMARSHS